jgi:hypothetical protein
MAMSSTRVMGTCAAMGQAVGTAAAMAIRNGIPPGEIGKQHMEGLQQTLLRDDCYLPWVRQEFSPLTRQAALRASSGDPEPLRDGINRPVGDDLHAWEGNVGDSIEYGFSRPQWVAEISLIFDSAMSKNIAMSHHGDYDQLTQNPPEMVRDFRIQIRTEEGWKVWREIEGNVQRLVRVELGLEVQGVRAVFDATWGADRVRLYAFYVD